MNFPSKGTNSSIVFDSGWSFIETSILPFRRMYLCPPSALNVYPIGERPNPMV